MTSLDDVDTKRIPKDVNLPSPATMREAGKPGAQKVAACTARETTAAGAALPTESSLPTAQVIPSDTLAVETDKGSTAPPTKEESGIAVERPLDDATGASALTVSAVGQSMFSAAGNRCASGRSRLVDQDESTESGEMVSKLAKAPAIAATAGPGVAAIAVDPRPPRRPPVMNATAHTTPMKGRGGDTEACDTQQAQGAWTPPPCTAESNDAPISLPHPDYVAAGVLPFCILGGDLLFLLGQQLRFQSRTKPCDAETWQGQLEKFNRLNERGPSSSKPDRVYGDAKGEEVRQSPSTRKPRLGPRPRLSSPLSSSRVVSQAHAFRLSPGVRPAAASEEAHPYAAFAAPVRDGSVETSQLESLCNDGTAEGFKPSAVGRSSSGMHQLVSSSSISCEPTQVARSPRGKDFVVVPAGELEIADSTVGDQVNLASSIGKEEQMGKSQTVQASSADAGMPTARAANPAVVVPSIDDQPESTAAGDDRAGSNVSARANIPHIATLVPSRRNGEGHRGVDRDPNRHHRRNDLQPEGKNMMPAGLLWSDFGGAREEGDVDAEGTASREFAEESLGLFHGVRLERDSVARSQAAMESLLRDPGVRGKKVFECRNGGYVMFAAAVDFVPDIMMKLARKEIIESGAGCHAGTANSDGAALGDEGESSAPHPRSTEKTDFAWVPASTLLGAMRESRHKSTKKVVVKLGGCRFLRLFHKFVISLWGLDLPAMIKAASTPIRRRKQPLPAPRVLLLKPGAVAGDEDSHPGKGARGSNSDTGRIETSMDGECSLSAVQGSGGVYNSKVAIGFRSDDGGGLPVGVRCAIRGIDCIRPSYLSGRKRTSLGIIDDGTPCRRSPRFSRRRTTAGDHWFGPEGGAASFGGTSSEDATDENDERGSADGGRWYRSGAKEGGTLVRGRGAGDGSMGLVITANRGSGGRSGAACRKKRRRYKEARRLKAAAAAAAAVAAAAATSTRDVSTPKHHEAPTQHERPVPP